MIEIGDKIVSKEIIEKKFICDLNSCKGACCVEGDSGAPLLKSEIKDLQRVYPIVKEYMSDAGIEAVEEKGVFVIDSDNDITQAGALKSGYEAIRSQRVSFVSFIISQLANN